MFEIDSIFAPVDFSESAKTVVALARGLGKPQPLVHPTHIIEAWTPYLRDVMFPYAPLGEDDVEIEAELVETASRMMAEHLGLPEKKDGSVQLPVVEVGSVKSRVCELAKASGTDLVVIGAFGDSGAVPDGLGSVALNVARFSGQPTLLARPTASSTINRIIVAIDLSPTSTTVYEAALGLAIRSGASLGSVHVVPDPYEDDTEDLLATVLRSDKRKIMSRSQDRVQAMFDRITQTLSPSYADKADVARLLKQRKVEFGPPATEVLRVANEADADLIVVGASSEDSATRLGRNAERIARRANCHVLVVPT